MSIRLSPFFDVLLLDSVSAPLAFGIVTRISLSLAAAVQLKLIKHGDQMRDVLARGT